MPFVARGHVRVEDDRQRDYHFGRGFQDLVALHHEGAEAHAHRHSAEDEVEDVPAAVALREMGREPVRPAIGFLEHVDRRPDLVSGDASFAVALPLVANLPFGMHFTNVANPDLADADRREQERILDPRADPPQALAGELAVELMLLLVGRRHQQPAQQIVHARPIDRALGAGIVGDGDDGRVEGAPQQAVGLVEVDRDMGDGGSAGDRELHHLTRAAAPFRRTSVPYRDQYVAVRDGGPARHHVSVDLRMLLAGKLERDRRPADQRVEALAGAVAGEAGAIMVAGEREDRLQLPAELERHFSRDLVGAVGDRRDEAQHRPVGGEAGPLAAGEVDSGVRDQLQDVADPRSQQVDLVLRKGLGAVAGHPDAEDERQARRACGRPRDA